MKRIVVIVVFSQLAWLSCNFEERNVNPVISNEAITTVILRLVNGADPSDTITAQWEQLLDNNGKPLPADVSQAHLDLQTNTSYMSAIMVLDKTQSPADTISIEIKELGNYHILFFQTLPTDLPLVIPHSDLELYPMPIPTPVPTGSTLDLSIEITDHDSNNPQLPIGLKSNFITGEAGAGWLRVVLRHQPYGKDGTYGPGATDLDVGFEITIH